MEPEHRLKRYWNRICRRNLNLYQKFCLVIIALGLLPMMVLSTVIMNRMFKEYGDSLRSNYEQAASYVNQSLQDMIEAYNGVSKMPYYYNYSSEGEFQYNFLSFDNLRQIVYGIGVEPELVEETRNNNMRIFLKNVQAVDNDIIGSHFIAEDLNGDSLTFHNFQQMWNMLSAGGETLFTQRMDMEKLDRTSKRLIMIPTHKNDYFLTQNEWVFTLARNYFDLTGVVGNYKYVGTLLIDIDARRFQDTFQNVELKKGDQIYICDQNQICYYSSDGTMTGKSLADGGPDLEESSENFVIETPYNSYGLKVIMTMNKEVAFEKIRNMQHMMYFFIGASLAALLLGSVWFSKRLTKPIHNMMDQMSEIESGNFKVQLPVTSGDEIGILSRRFNQMSRELETYINQSYVAHMKQAEAEMTALKSQIYPHFLYNTLEVIRMTALERDDMTVSDMIEALSQQIRYMIGPMQDMVPLEKETDIIRKYVYLLNCRITGKVHLSVDLNGLGGVPVPKLILQPIVENAYVHGIKPKDGMGNVLISAEHVNGDSPSGPHAGEERLEISIMDNGVGMDEAALHNIRRLLDSDEIGIKNEHNWQSIGLKNVHDRIKYMYGEAYGIEITSTPSVGTMVRILMPWGKGEDHVKDDSGR